MKMSLLVRLGAGAVTAAALCFMVCVPARAQTPDLLAAAKTQGVIRIANTQSTPPWTMLDDNNQPAGYDVDVARELAGESVFPKWRLSPTRSKILSKVSRPASTTS